MSDAAAPWIEWLDSADGRASLKTAAEFIFRQSARLSLPADLLPCNNPWSLPADQREDCFQMLAADLWIFLRSQTGAQLEKLIAAGQIYSQGRMFMLKLAQHFLSSLRDQARTLERDPARALYRRLRQVLYEAPEVHYLAGANGVYFSLQPDAPVLPHPELLHADSYESWQAPLDEVNRRGLTQRKNLLKLATLFYSQAVARIGGDYYLPVRELLSYIRCHYAELSGVNFEPLEDSHVAQTAAGDGTSAAVDAQAVGPVACVYEKLPELAKQIVAAWSMKERRAFALIQGDELTLEAAAARLGYSSAAGVRYVYQNALNTLRDYCLLWPGLSPPELDERLFENLILTIIRICRGPDSGDTGADP
jgi:hypothetical protein